jgi:phytoene dehydrogenase-like protein
MENNNFDVIIVGSGIAGLTAAAFLAKEKHNVLLLEKDDSYGGLLGAFNVNGHWLDKGARGIIDSGIIFPMLKQLGLTIEFTDNPIKMTFAHESMDFINEDSITDYELLLKKIFPEEHKNIEAILNDVRLIMTHMDVLYGIENPLFLPKPYDLNYVSKTLLPWMFKFIIHMRKAMKFMQPVDEYLKTKTSNQSLIDLISQHFFAKTPTFFALSYFTLYLEYHYPKGSTQSFINVFIDYLNQHNVVLKKQTEVISIHPDEKLVVVQDNQQFTYKELIWTADTNKFYDCLNIESVESSVLKEKLIKQKSFFKDKKGADSILTVYMITNLDPEYFREKNGPHAFYTPKINGLSSIPLSNIQDSNGNFTDDKNKLFDWIKTNLAFNTFEISIPSLRDVTLSPKGKSALIVSVLFDYELTQHIYRCGYYEEYKQLVSQEMVHCLHEGLWDSLKQNIVQTIVSTPKTIYDRTYATQGSVTGWSFDNKPFPVEFKFLNVSKSVITPIKNIKQAGQFTFNPAGVPVAVLTGKLAADAVHKDLVKRK